LTQRLVHSDSFGQRGKLYAAISSNRDRIKFWNPPDVRGKTSRIDSFQMTDDQWDSGMEFKLHRAHGPAFRAQEASKSTKNVAGLVACKSMVVLTGFAVTVGVINAEIVAFAKVFCRSRSRGCIHAKSVSSGAVIKGYGLSVIKMLHCMRNQSRFIKAEAFETGSRQPLWLSRRTSSSSRPF